jgi:phage terminase large subunit
VSSTLSIDTPRWFVPLLEPARYKGIWGGRGSGKSHAVAEYIIERSIMGRCDVVCIREVQRSLQQSVKRLLEMKIEQLEVQEYFEIQHDRIKSIHGGLIIFTGMTNHTADSIKSLESFDISWFEEAQSCSQRSLDLLRPTMRKQGSELIFTWNPHLSTDPIDVLLRSDNPPPDSKVIRVNYMDNPWFPDVLKQEMEYDANRDPDKYAHVWLGEYVRNTQSRVFSNWRVEEFDTNPEAMFRLGADWGFAKDPTVLVRCYTEGRTLYVDYEAYQVGCEIMDTPDLFYTIPDSEKWPIIADSARPETISHMRKNGFPKIQPAVKGAHSVDEGIEFMKTYDIVVHPRCRHVIDELTLYSYKVDPLTEAVLPVLEDKNNHVIDALRYALEAVRRGQSQKKVEARPIPVVNRW